MKLRRSLLFIPGNSPNMMINAPVLGADGVIFDIEDAVAVDDKDTARILIRNTLQWIARSRIELCVRINDFTTPYWKLDMDAVIPAKPDSLVVPKVETVERFEEMSAYAASLEEKHGLPVGSVKFLPILETAVGIENAFIIAQSCKGRLDALLMGGEDLATDLGAIRNEKTNEELLYGRLRVLNAARAAGLTPIDTAFAAVEDAESFYRDTQFSRQIGYAGRAVISPRQVAPANEIYSPSEKAVRLARETIEVYEEARAAGKGAVSLYGKMIDAPIITRAKQILEFAELMKGGN